MSVKAKSVIKSRAAPKTLPKNSIYLKKKKIVNYLSLCFVAVFL